MIPQIENSITNNVIEIMNYPNKSYKLGDFQIAGKVDNLQAIEQSIKHILSVERYAYLIYDDNYGVELEKYIGKDFSYLEATIEDTLREALLQDDRIVDVEVTDISENIELQARAYQNMVYEKLNTQNDKNILEEPQLKYMTTEGVSKMLTLPKSAIKVANVKFDVYCKEGVIHTEVNINV